MRVFMLGWEFPPHISGGLGTACYGLTRGLDEIGVEVCFVLPTSVPVSAESHVQLRSPADLAGNGRGDAEDTEALIAKEFQHVRLHRLAAVIQPYGTPETQQKVIEELRRRQAEAEAGAEAGAKAAAKAGAEAGAKAGAEAGAEDMEVHAPEVPAGSFSPVAGTQYDGDLMGQVQRYARLAVELARRERFDIVHAHDWMTFPAGLAVAAATHKPLVVHVHSTEFDRAGDNIDQHIYDIERMGMHGADHVVCVSLMTRSIITRRYELPSKRVDVIYNAVRLPIANNLHMAPIKRHERIVLFLGRLTMQKGPEYFLEAAKKVVEKFQDVRFVLAGSGDMIARCVEDVARLGIGRYVTFTGFLESPDVDRIFSMADLYVMPSVSEPFGIAPLEALSHNVPVIISKQSGVSEVLTHALKVDFWDTDEMANKILAVLRHKPLRKTLRQHGQIELRKFSWRDSATRLNDIYTTLVPAAG